MRSAARGDRKALHYRPMVALGVILGLMSTVFISVCYLLMRHNNVASRGRLSFIVRGQAIQGIVCIALLPWVWPRHLPANTTLLLPATASAATFLLGQVFLLSAMRFTEASRIAPLIGMKVALVALITVMLLGNRLDLLQWLAVALAVLAAFVLNRTGGRLPVAALLGAAAACLCYACSDVAMGQTIHAIRAASISKLHISIFAVTLAYSLGGVIVACGLPWFGSRQQADWLRVTPFAASWLAGAVSLITCFTLLGVVFGGILQSTRGMVSIVLGAALAAFGFEHLEQKLSRSVLYRRLAAAGLMSLAIALFLLGR